MTDGEKYHRPFQTKEGLSEAEQDSFFPPPKPHNKTRTNSAMESGLGIIGQTCKCV